MIQSTLNRWTLVLTLLPMVACGSQKAADIAALDGDLANGEVVYDDSCASCHGAAGSGGSGPALDGESEGTEEIIDIILTGEGDMPSFEGDLTDQEIADVAAYVESLGTGSDED